MNEKGPEQCPGLIILSFRASCACAASGHPTATPVRRVIISRRLIASSEAQDWASCRLKLAHRKEAMAAAISDFRGLGTLRRWMFLMELQNMGSFCQEYYCR